MQAFKLANSHSEKARLKEKCMSILARAEEIKKIEQWQPPLDHIGSAILSNEALRIPCSRRNLSTREEVILLEGSKLHGLIFPPWVAEPDENEFAASDGDIYVYAFSHRNRCITSNRYSDPSEINISKEHAHDSAGWRRPLELLERTFTEDAHQGTHATNKQPTMLASADIDLVQDVTADCSVVASLCAAVARPGGTYGKVGWLRHKVIIVC